MRISDLIRAAINDAKLQQTNLEGATIFHCRFMHTDLSGANLRGVASLDSVRDLGRASFHQTVVTPKQLETIEKTFCSLGHFDVRGE